MDRAGQQFGNYRLVRLLGRGGYADTYLAEHVYLRTPAAVKLLSTQLTQDGVERFYQESRTIANLNHPNIIRMLDFGSVHDTPYLVMDYAPNGTLRQLHRRGTILSVQMIVPYVRQVAAALQYAHNQHIVHRDVKPENMLLGEDERVLLSDFGSALLQDAQHKRDVAGTVTYMAPEQIAGRPCPASDQYALGAVVYEWLCGMPPFLGSQVEVAIQQERARPPRLCERISTLPSTVEEVVFIALAKESGQRFANIQAFATALEQAAKDATIIRPALHNDKERFIATQITASNKASTTPSSPGSPTRRESQNQSTLNKSTSIVPDGQVAPTPQLSRQARLLQGGQTTHSTQRGAAYPRAPQLVSVVATPTPEKPSAVQAPGVVKPRPDSSRRTSILVALVTLLVIGSMLSLFFTAYLPNQRRIQATATAQGYATTTARSRATSSAVARATVQAQSTVTARQALYTQSTVGRPALNDALQSANNSDWDAATYTDSHKRTIGACNFANGSYFSQAQTSYFIRCLAEASDYGNLTYQVQITVVDGQTGGLLIRADADGSGYYFSISMDGSYSLQKVAVDSSGNSVNTVLVSGNSAAIKIGQSNLLTVIAHGSNIYLYINKQYVDQANDKTYTSGRIGIYADGDTENARVVARDARVWTT
jgi:eukaryotic-like serine/threonine-protein kinase